MEGLIIMDKSYLHKSIKQQLEGLIIMDKSFLHKSIKQQLEEQSQNNFLYSTTPHCITPSQGLPTKWYLVCSTQTQQWNHFSRNTEGQPDVKS